MKPNALTSLAILYSVAFSVAFAAEISNAQVVQPPAVQPAPNVIEVDKAEATVEPRFGIEKHGGIVFHKTDKYLLKCDVYQPIPEIESDETMPAVIMIHGGAWRTGSKLSMLRHARRLARKGYVVMSINYRLAPKYPWPAQIEDCRVALKWLNDNAATYKIDTQRVGVYGYSAGGHLAAMLATTNEINDIEIRAAVTGGTPAEFSWIEEDARTLVYWLGAKRADAAEVYLNASPTNFVTDDDPPFLLFHGIDDSLVPIESAKLLDKKLRFFGVESELVEVSDVGHFGAFSKIDLMDDVIEFFDSHLKPPAQAK